MGKIYARLIYKYKVEHIETPYHSLSDVPAKYREATQVAYKELFGLDIE